MTGPRNINPILGLLVLALAPHLPRLPVWVDVWCLAGLAYSYFAYQRNWPLPGKRLVALTALAGAGGVVLTFGNIFVMDAGVAATAILLSLKPLEIKNHRDRVVTVFMVYFLIIANLFSSQSLLMAVYMAAAVVLTQSVLIHVHHQSSRLTAKLRLSGVIFLQALPIMIVLFLFFPRLPVGFGLASPLAQSGFSEEMKPGDITQLALSEEIAFRAEFKGPIPRQGELYWRGLVLWDFDGRAWRQGNLAPYLPYRKIPYKENRIAQYSVTMPPHGRRWLFALDWPLWSNARASVRQDFGLLSYRILKNRLRYDVISALDYHPGLNEKWAGRGLDLPDGGNPQARALAGKWAAMGGGPEAIVRRGLAFFQQNRFVYTLNPPVLGRQQIDEFLFSTRRGFCEHYASSFAFLMRAAGIPSRIVVGYQGGEKNPLGDYLIIRQYDAHAWVEIRLPGRGWVRLDPTNIVAPDRVEKGMQAALAPKEKLNSLLGDRLGGFYTYALKARYAWDALNFYWDHWVLDYNYLRQRRFFSDLGLDVGSWRGAAQAGLAALGMIGMTTLLVYLWLKKRRHSEVRDKIQENYLKFCTKLAKIGLNRPLSQGPLDYSRAARGARPDLSKTIREITGLYIDLRYGRNGDREMPQQLARLVKRFKPGKSSADLVNQ
ncbi:MAG: DUF3488 and transglutaminase-like domain-containing protein [Pseudomonadota bacterium]